MEKPKINNLPDKNPMPEIHLFKPWDKIKTMLGSLASGLGNLPNEPLSAHSDHFVKTNDMIVDNDTALAERMMSKPEAQEAFEQLRIEFDSLPDVKQPHDWRQYPDLANYNDEPWDVV